MADYPITRSSPRLRGYLFMIAVVCVIATVVIFVNWIVDQINLSTNGEPDFTTLSQSELKDGLFVTGTIYTALGPYAEEYTVDKYGHESSSSSNDYFYLVPILSEQNDYIECFVSYKANPNEDRDHMDEIVQDTMEGTDSVPLSLEHGYMVNLADDQRRILNNWVTTPDFYENGSFVDYCAEYDLMGTIDKDAILSKIMTYSIKRTMTAGINIADICIPAVPGGICVLLLVILQKYDKARMRKYVEEMAARQYNENNQTF